jgi:hypothetical protein
MVEYESEGIVIKVRAQMLSLIGQYEPAEWSSVHCAPALLGLVWARSMADLCPHNSGLAAHR